VSGIDQVVGAQISALIGEDSITGLGVAVSGGGDSLALMLLAADWARGRNTAFRIVTVDHGLRPEAADEARCVARIAGGRGLAHDTVTWTGWDGRGNLQDRAREARFDLIAQWAQRHRLSHVALGHTADDQAETLLMRLARGAGVDGLSAIPVRRCVDGVTFIRPMLGLARADIRSWLETQGQDWVEDPSNDDSRFERVRVRQAMAHLEQLGIDRDSLATVAENMAEARKALNWFTYLAARDIVQVQFGDVVIDRGGYRSLPSEIQRRVMAHVLCWIGGTRYPPRRKPLKEMVAAALSGDGMTLHGCRLLPGHREIRITREYAAVAGLRGPVSAVWDGRWRFMGPAGQPRLHVAALGEAGLAQCPDWRDAGLPHASMLGCPAVWDGNEVLAAPLAGFGSGWRQILTRDEEEFFAALMMR
jgi:tRNA(Ile)-lysidine synthase